jgi:hypothetical protein
MEDICKIVGSHFSEFSPSFTSWAEFESKSLPRDLSKKQCLIDSYSLVFFLVLKDPTRYAVAKMPD